MDQTFQEEQQHLSDIYAQLVRMRDALSDEIETSHKGIAQDLIDMSEEIRPDFVGIDETMETLAAIETLNSVIDTYNQIHDFTVDKLRRVLILLMQPYFAKVRLQMRPGRPAQDVYIGATGITDEHRRPLIVDWRSPIAETYYNQEMGQTSYQVDGRTRTVNLELRRQFDIAQDVLRMYFDTTVAIEDSLLLRALKRHHSEKLQAITATIQREQNAIVRHIDVPVMLVNGIAGSGKTSVLLQRIAFLFYREREALRPDQVYLFTPNSVFEHYIDTVLPSLGESNPQTYTWRGFLARLGLSERGTGADGSPERLVRLEEQRSAAVGEQEALVAKLYDEYELTQTDAEEQAAPVADAAAANRRLAELRAKIRALGAVNVAAIEEYREVSARYEELSHQMNDVEHSKKELSRLIGELTGRMREIFTEKFTEIDKNFRTTFTELFEGGSASLSLTDPEDVLESGIEINVHPPGKLIKNLAALSGGEQAFVAIAIFFAILRVNPAPFCIMDEIEAALDDVNVTRFAAYLRRLTDETQFIAITHRRGTMEEADDLYGVTMQEEGVSKLLRLQVSEIEKTMQTAGLAE